MKIPFSFSQYTSPLNPSASLSFTLQEDQEVSLRIYNNKGQVIHTLYENRAIKAGRHELQLFGGLIPQDGCYARLQTLAGVEHRTLVIHTDYIPDRR